MNMKRILGLCAAFALALALQAQSLTAPEAYDALKRGLALQKEQKHEEALAAFLAAGQSEEQPSTELERQVRVFSLTNACQALYKLERYEECYQLAKKLLAGALAEVERKIAASWYTFSGYLCACDFLGQKTGNNPAQARALFEEILPYAEKDMEKRIHSKIPDSWYAEGTGYQMVQLYDKALPCMKKAAEGYHALGNTQDEVKALCQIGSIHHFLYQLPEALQSYGKARDLCLEHGLVDNLFSVLAEEKKLYAQAGNTREEARVTEYIDSLVAASDNPKVAFNYHHYKGDEAKAQGAMDLAELWYKKNEPFTHQGGLEGWGYRSMYYHKLRELYTAMGRNNEALHYARLGMSERKLETPRDSILYYLGYISIAQIYKQMGDRERCMAALDTLFRSERFYTDPKGKQHLYTVRATCHQAFKAYDKALADYQKMDEILATKYPETDADRITLLALMGGMEHKLGHYERSERLYAAYAERKAQLHGKGHKEAIEALRYLANAEGFAGHLDAGCSHYVEAMEGMRANLREQLPYLTTAERDGYWQDISSLFTHMAPFALQAGRTQTAFTRSCYDGLILAKAFLLESDRSASELIRKSGDAEALAAFEEMGILQLKVAAWKQRPALYADSITSASARIGRLSRTLAARCREYGDQTAFLDVDCDAVRKALGKDDLLVDFTDYVPATGGRKYAAFVLSKGQEFPLLQPLFAESEIDSLCLQHPDYFYEEPYAAQMRRLLWQPLAAHAKQGATIYYVPSQLLFQVSLESLPMEDGTLLGEHYRFVRLSSARELVRYRARLDMDVPAPAAVLYGGLQYDMEAAQMAQRAKDYELPNLFALRGGMLRGDSVFCELPGTRQEVDAVAAILQKRKVEVSPRKGTEGTAESFVSLSGKAPKLLLLATHGFYYTPKEAERHQYLKGYGDAMSLSGLVFAGGNAAWLGKPLPHGVMGGILTAHDIAALDLDGLELVVLSACQTGQGKATAEGLYGLQRAFKKAGARSLVMTLWNVSDQVTRDFMVAFHEQLADPQNHWDKRAAFEKAKTHIRKQYPEAFYWAGFVMLD